MQAENCSTTRLRFKIEVFLQQIIENYTQLKVGDICSAAAETVV
jgi:hypothetical protein